MQKTLSILFAALLVLSVSSCGKKGSLRTPTQMQSDAAKKARKDEKTARQKSKDEKEAQENNTDATTPEENAAPPIPRSSPQPTLQPMTSETK